MPANPPLQDNTLSAATKYNPHLWGDAQLRSIFVVRKQELETLTEAIRTTAANSVPQHILITGHRGMGKSTLLRRVALAVRDDKELSRDWLALSFPEEQYTVSNLTEFWRNVLDALADTLEHQGCPPDQLVQLDAAIANIENLPVSNREDAALALLTDYIQRSGQRILLLIDSTDQLFGALAGGSGKSSNDGSATPLWRLRKTLSHEKGIFWLGASYQALEAQHQYQDAFHDFFQLLELRSLTVNDMREAMLALARTFGMGLGLQGEAAVAEMTCALDSRPERLKALRAMTGGNPRTTVMLYDLFAAGDEGNVHNDLRGLLDMMTPLYKARMESLAEQPRKILAHLMELWSPQSVRELAAAADIPATTVSGQLSRLEAEGLIEKAKLAKGKRNGYQVAERFFNVWYLMRYSSRRQRLRLTWLIEFMRLWFSSDELVNLAHTRVSRHGNGQMCEESSLEYSRALACALPEGHSERYRLEWSVFSAAQRIACDTTRAIHELFDFEGEDKEFATADDYLKRFNSLDAQLARCPHAKNEEEWIAAVKSSIILNLSDKELIAEVAANIEKSLYNSTFNLLKKQESYLPLPIQQAVLEGRFFPDCPDSKLAYTQLVAAFSDDPETFHLALHLMRNPLQDFWLEKAYCNETEFFPDDPYIIADLARLQAANGKTKLATTNYRKVASLAANFSEDIGNELLLQSQLWLQNQDAARQALETLAKRAAEGDKFAFLDLKEQALKCHQIGKGMLLAQLMMDSSYADFLKPISLALRAAGDEGKDIFAEAPPEVVLMAEEVYAEIMRRGEQAGSP